MKQRLQNFEDVMFRHEGRETNFEAHNLGQSVLDLSVGRHVWLTEPWKLWKCNDACNLLIRSSYVMLKKICQYLN
jgi:hypothetical protein